MARSPIVPPGKISGRTTNESVVKARREPLSVNTAPSCRCSSMGLPNAGMKIFSMSWWVSRPPPPCASTMRSSATRGTGQLRLNSVMTVIVLPPAVVIIGRARALRRNHRRAQRIFRRALHRKLRTLVRLFEALQNQAADALGRLVSHFSREREAAVGIMFLKTPAQLKAAGRNLYEAAPLPVHHLKHFNNAFLRRTVPFPPLGPRVLVLHFVAAFFQLAHRHENAIENVEWLEASHHDWHFVPLRDRKIFFVAHDGADVACRQKSLDHAIRRRQQRFHGGRNQHVRNQQREVVDVVVIGLPRGHRIGRRSGLETYGKEYDLPLRIRS